MWLLDLVSTAEEAPSAPPEIPFEQIGIILVALVTGITAIIVALIQRGKTKSETKPETTPVATGSVFIISKDDWEKVRDGVLRLDAQFSQFRTDYDYHERWTTGEVRDMSNEISRMKGHLGIP